MDKTPLSEIQGTYTCPECGFNFVPSEPNDLKMHEEKHRFIMEPHQPIAFKVTSHSPRSDHLLWPAKDDDHSIRVLLRQYAVAFKRELKTDFPQWSSDEFGRRDVHPFLIIGESQFVGAGVFRQHRRGEAWSLAWIWICKEYRRKGLLREIWPTFKQDNPQLKGFSVETPVSTPMKSFLVSIEYPGASDLIEF